MKGERSPSPACEPTLFDKVRDAVACYETDGTIVYVNPVACALFALEPEALVGRKLWSLFPGAERDDFHRAFERVVHTTASEQLESHYAPWNRWFEHEIYFDQGRVWTIARDITEQKSAQIRLETLARASRVFSEALNDGGGPFETIARYVAETVQDACVIRLLSADRTRFESPVGAWDPDPSVRDTLRAAPSAPADEGAGAEVLATGRPLLIAQLDSRTVAQRIAPADRHAYVAGLGIHSAIIAPLRSGGRVLGVLSVIRRRDRTQGAYRDGDRLLVEELADRTALVAEELRTLRALEAERSRFYRMVEDAPFAVVAYEGPDHRATYSNRAHERMTANRVRIGHPLLESLPELAGSDVIGKLDRVYRSGTVERADELYSPMLRDGVPQGCWFDVTWQPIADVDGRTIGVLASAIEVTEHVRAREERRGMLEDLRAAVEARDEFLSIASHELRTPLTTLELQLDGVRRAFERQDAAGAIDSARRKLAVAQRQVDRLTSLVTGLVDASRLASEPLRLQVERFDLGSLVAEVIERFDGAAERRGSALTWQRPEVPIMATADRSRMDQALSNLVSNAVSFGAGQPVHVSLAYDDRTLSVAVCDRGIGIDVPDQQRIFGRFERAVSSHHYGGLGLGLYIAAQIAAAHRGAIEVQSALGEGSTFTLRWPREWPGESA